MAFDGLLPLPEDRRRGRVRVSGLLPLPQGCLPASTTPHWQKASLLPRGTDWVRGRGRRELD